MRKEKPAGTCARCKERYQKADAAKHLYNCKGLKPGKAEAFLLQVEGSGMPQYWLHLVAGAGASLRQLDALLRKTWLECCGHMSAFDIHGKTYSSAPMAEMDDLDMAVGMGEVLKPNLVFLHRYDFGSTTELKLKVLTACELGIGKSAVLQLGCNDPPEYFCGPCGKPAESLCGECSLEEKGKGMLCASCAKEHGCGEEMILPLANSPRAAVCAYEG